MSARFNIKAAEPEAVASLQRELHMPHFIAATLVSRGIDTPEAANRFLTPSLDRDWRDLIIPRVVRRPPMRLRPPSAAATTSSCSAISTWTASPPPPS